MPKSRLLLVLLCSAAAAPAAALEFTNPNGSSVKLYGQLNPAYLTYDDGQETNGALVDNNNSNSRAYLFVYWPFADETKLTFNFETSLGFFQSNNLNITSFEGQQWYSWSESDIRKLELNYASNFGTIWAGQGSMPTDGIAEIDYSKTSVIGLFGLSGRGYGFAFRESDGDLSSITVKKVFINLEGTRRMRLRYDTPDFNGFKFSVAVYENVLTGDNKYYADAAIRYENKFGDVKFGAYLGYNYSEDKDDSDINTEAWMGSVSAIHEPSGINGTLATGAYAGQDGNYVYAKFGWTGEVWDIGATSVAAEYYNSNDIGLDGSGTSWGLMAVQAVKPWNTEVYMGYRKYALDSDTTNYDDSASFMVYARWKF
ncbi:MAG: porin [Exiguobacterium profundum]|nr:MAG: porin [Exiguobacterium profundum]